MTTNYQEILIEFIILLFLFLYFIMEIHIFAYLKCHNLTKTHGTMYIYYSF